MEIKIGKHIITSKRIFSVLFAFILIATISEIITNIFFEKRFNTETVVPLAFFTYVCYRFSGINKKHI